MQHYAQTLLCIIDQLEQQKTWLESVDSSQYKLYNTDSEQIKQSLAEIDLDLVTYYSLCLEEELTENAKELTEDAEIAESLENVEHDSSTEILLDRLEAKIRTRQRITSKELEKQAAALPLSLEEQIDRILQDAVYLRLQAMSDEPLLGCRTPIIESCLEFLKLDIDQLKREFSKPLSPKLEIAFCIYQLNGNIKTRKWLQTRIRALIRPYFYKIDPEQVYPLVSELVSLAWALDPQQGCIWKPDNTHWKDIQIY